MKEVQLTVDGKDYVVVSPSASQVIDSRTTYNTAFRKALDSGAYLRKSFDKVLEAQGLWSAEKSKKMSSLQFVLAKLERKLESKIKLSEAKTVAHELAKARSDLKDLVYERTALDDRTAEGQAEQARIEYLCSVCLLDHATRKPVYKSPQDMVTSGDAVVDQALDRIATMIYEVDPDFESKLPENKFFKRFGEPSTDIDPEMANLFKEMTEITPIGDVETIEYEDDDPSTPE
jgi:hypothetical protein